MNRVDQTAVPLCGIPWPDPQDLDPETSHKDLPLIFMANDEYKYKIVNYETSETLATFLGPRFDKPVGFVRIVERTENSSTRPYLLFATKNLIGLQQLPIDGNPWRSMAMLGHPNQLTKMDFRNDKETLFSCGAKDSCVCQWTANFQSVDDTALRGGTELDPYYCLIDNGRPGWLFQEIRDLFYYVQILCQGTYSPAMLCVSDYIPIDSLPDLMRAVGFFPSEYEVANMIREAKYKVYLKEPITQIDFEEFVKLYVNHRPAFSENMKKITAAFKVLASKEERDLVISRDEFIDILCEYGEKYTRETAWYLLSILSGHSFEERALMVPEDFSFLPEEIKLQEFMSTVMGVGDFEADPTHSHTSTGSGFTGSTIFSDED